MKKTAEQLAIDKVYSPKVYGSRRPAYRRLRVYALDPGLNTELAHAAINHITLKVPWEIDPVTGEDLLQVGPVGEYLEVVDVDPASNCAYEPINLNDPYLLAQDGHPPSEGNPQFHQQMVYAVAMTTIKNFERALGRTAFWAERPWSVSDTSTVAPREPEFVQRLRIYPHGMREANAYYSPEKKALLFGYFKATPADARDLMPDTMVFTCLSHDIVAHETTHALLDGMHRRFIEPSNPDVLAFHEAFADIVALFQHFSFPEVLRHQVAKTRGDLASENLLGQLAQQFGRGLNSRGALRDALGEEKDGKWQRKQANPLEITRVWEPHDRGAILVSAIFDAFIAIYQARIADLLRIATSGTGILPKGELHPDLVNRLALEASKAAQHILNMCIRALDYCPPVDITFGEYLRALITADYELVPDDDLGYRVAVVEAFRRRGIYPPGVRTLSVESLLWVAPTDEEAQFCKPLMKEIGTMAREWDLSNDRKQTWDALETKRRDLHRWLKCQMTLPEDMNAEDRAKCAEVHQSRLYQVDSPSASVPVHVMQNFLGLDLSLGAGKFEVHSLRPARRNSPDGDVHIDLVIEITQRRLVAWDAAQQKKLDRHRSDKQPTQPYFVMRGGCTLIVDVDTAQVRYCVRKPVCNDQRLNQQRNFRQSVVGQTLRAQYFGSADETKEPFALLHREGL